MKRVFVVGEGNIHTQSAQKPIEMKIQNCRPEKPNQTMDLPIPSRRSRMNRVFCGDKVHFPAHYLVTPNSSILWLCWSSWSPVAPPTIFSGIWWLKFIAVCPSMFSAEISDEHVICGTVREGILWWFTIQNQQWFLDRVRYGIGHIFNRHIGSFITFRATILWPNMYRLLLVVESIDPFNPLALFRRCKVTRISLPFCFRGFRLKEWNAIALSGDNTLWVPP